jgi:hypothetical protein
MPQSAPDWINQTPWKVDVQDRLRGVDADIERAISIKSWRLNKPGQEPGHEHWILPLKQDAERTPLMDEAEAVVKATYCYIAKTSECLPPPARWWQRLRERLGGGLLMSAYTSLHAAETNRVLLLSSDQLAAILPTIRERATAYLPTDDVRLAALNSVLDPTVPAHQALARVQGALVNSVIGAHARAQAQAQAQEPPPAPDKAPAPAAEPAPGQQPEAAQTAAPGAAAEPAPGQQPEAAQTAAPGAAAEPAPGQQPAPAPPGPTAPTQAPAPDQDSNITKLTEMLGPDQQMAAMVMDAACRAEDLRQSEVRHFRNVLLGTFAGLLILVVVLAIVGIIHPKYFPLCVPNSQKSSVICPAGGSTPSMADLPLIMGLGVVGAALAVAVFLTGLKPAGVRYSLSVGQGLVKLAFGAITAMLGIIILSTQSSVGVLGSQAGLLTTAVVFGYSQQLFTRLIDQQANDLVTAASSTTKAGGAGSP